MSRFVVVVNEPDAIRAHVEDYGGEILDDLPEAGAGQVAAVVKFDDEAEGGKFSRRVNGTVYRAEWAARENARHRATASV